MAKLKNAATVAVGLYSAVLGLRILCWLMEGIAWLTDTNLGVLALSIAGLAILALVLAMTKSLASTVLAVIVEALVYLVTILGGKLATVVGHGLGYCVFTVVGAVILLVLGAVIGFTAKESES